MKNYNGWINVFKPKNISSFNVIRKVKKVFKFSKIGHAGTLDPAAEGILPLAVGKSTKLISFINEKEKIYEFNIKWGLQTDTDDQDGQIINFCKKYHQKMKLKKYFINL